MQSVSALNSGTERQGKAPPTKGREPLLNTHSVVPNNASQHKHFTDQVQKAGPRSNSLKHDSEGSEKHDVVRSQDSLHSGHSEEMGAQPKEQAECSMRLSNWCVSGVQSRRLLNCF